MKCHIKSRISAVSINHKLRVAVLADLFLGDKQIEVVENVDSVLELSLK